MRIRTLGGFAVQTDDLLPGGMSESSKDSRFGHSAIALVLEYSTNGNAAVAEGAKQESARFVITHDADGQDGYSEIGKVANRIGSTARNHPAIAVLEDQHRRFAGDARDFAEDELIRDQISEDGDRGLRKRLHDLAQAVIL